jgi:hypothetical protein
MAAGGRGLDRALARAEPVERVIELDLVDRPEPEQPAQAWLQPAGRKWWDPAENLGFYHLRSKNLGLNRLVGTPAESACPSLLPIIEIREDRCARCGGQDLAAASTG